MSETNSSQLGGIHSLTNLIYSLSFYAPLIVTVSILIFSIFSSSLEKAGVYLLWIFVITFLRVIIMKLIQMSQKGTPLPVIPEVCLTGLTHIFIPQDITYSTYILCFTMFYLIMPMIMVSSQSHSDSMNYIVMAFFIAYILFDLFIKKTLACIPSLFSVSVFGDIISGCGLGALIAGPLMFGTSLRSLLYINELNSNKEVCSMASKQHFRCSVYKNGELVGSSMN
uniref:Uncharacterized protein n=1 Tax=viral metagenome TaxID=1070528 RepID=A0A6C0IRV9_9ZZZZ